MQYVVPVREEKRSAIPSAVQVDGTCRIHTVERGSDSPYARLLTAFEERTGLPLLINTSFNRKGEPIVANPREAYQCFQEVPLSLLAMESVLVRR